MNHLETLLREYLETRGYIVVQNVKVGRLPHGGWRGELDVVGYCPRRDHLIHYEPSFDANSWSKRQERFDKKFATAREHLLEVPQFSFLSETDILKIEQFAVFPSVPSNRRNFCGAIAIGVDELTSEIVEFVRERGSMMKNVFPEQFPLLRTIQLVVCGINGTGPLSAK